MKDYCSSKIIWIEDVQPKRGKSIVGRINHDGATSRMCATFSEDLTWAEFRLETPDWLQHTVIEYQPFKDADGIYSVPFRSVAFPDIDGVVFVVSRSPKPEIDVRYTRTPPTSAAVPGTPPASPTE